MQPERHSRSDSAYAVHSKARKHIGSGRGGLFWDDLFDPARPTRRLRDWAERHMPEIHEHIRRSMRPSLTEAAESGSGWYEGASDPSALADALAYVTAHLGIAVTTSTQQEDPPLPGACLSEQLPRRPETDPAAAAT